MAAKTRHRKNDDPQRRAPSPSPNAPSRTNTVGHADEKRTRRTRTWAAPSPHRLAKDDDNADRKVSSAPRDKDARSADSNVEGAPHAIASCRTEETCGERTSGHGAPDARARARGRNGGAAARTRVHPTRRAPPRTPCFARRLRRAPARRVSLWTRRTRRLDVPRSLAARPSILPRARWPPWPRTCPPRRPDVRRPSSTTLCTTDHVRPNPPIHVAHNTRCACEATTRRRCSRKREAAREDEERRERTRGIRMGTGCAIRLARACRVVEDTRAQDPKSPSLVRRARRWFGDPVWSRQRRPVRGQASVWMHGKPSPLAPKRNPLPNPSDEFDRNPIDTSRTSTRTGT